MPLRVRSCLVIVASVHLLHLGRICEVVLLRGDARIILVAPSWLRVRKAEHGRGSQGARGLSSRFYQLEIQPARRANTVLESELPKTRLVGVLAPTQGSPGNLSVLFWMNLSLRPFSFKILKLPPARNRSMIGV
jgi:hypothetical protein